MTPMMPAILTCNVNALATPPTIENWTSWPLPCSVAIALLAGSIKKLRIGVVEEPPDHGEERDRRKTDDQPVAQLTQVLGERHPPVGARGVPAARHLHHRVLLGRVSRARYGPEVSVLPGLRSLLDRLRLGGGGLDRDLLDGGRPLRVPPAG